MEGVGDYDGYTRNITETHTHTSVTLQQGASTASGHQPKLKKLNLWAWVCVSVCMCVRERVCAMWWMCAKPQVHTTTMWSTGWKPTTLSVNTVNSRIHMQWIVVNVYSLTHKTYLTYLCNTRTQLAKQNGDPAYLRQVYNWYFCSPTMQCSVLDSLHVFHLMCTYHESTTLCLSVHTIKYV